MSDSTVPTGQASPWSHKPTLAGEHVTLRPFRDEDLPHVLVALGDPEVNRLTGSVNTSEQARSAAADLRSPQEKARLRQWYASRADQTHRMDLMVVDNAAGHWVGEVVFNHWDEANESCNFRILMAPGGQNRGLGSEAIRLFLDHGFTHLPLHRVHLGVYAFNPRARHVYEKAGFVVEGRERDALSFDGRRVDQVMMSVLRPEWEAARRA